MKSLNGDDVCELAVELFNVLSKAHNDKVRNLAAAKESPESAALAAYIALQVLVGAFEQVYDAVSPETRHVVDEIIDDLSANRKTYTVPSAQA